MEERKMSRKVTNTCLTCLDYYGCMKTDLKPSPGECFSKRPDHRRIVLSEIKDAVRKTGSVGLRRPVRIRRDYIGVDMQHIVRVVRPFPGTRIESMEFSLGRDEQGDEVSTMDVSTEDLYRIRNEFTAG